MAIHFILPAPSTAQLKADNTFFQILVSNSQVFGNFDLRLLRLALRRFSPVYASLHQDKLIAVIIYLQIPSQTNFPSEEKSTT